MTRRCTLRALALLLLASSTAAAPAAAEALLVLPVDGAGLLPTVRDDVERTLRAALADMSGVTVQPREATDAILADAAAGGLACAIDSVPCAKRLGVIADADAVVIASLQSLGAVLVVTVVDVRDGDVKGGGRSRIAGGAIKLPAKDAGATVRQVVERALQPSATLELTGRGAGAAFIVDGIALGSGAGLPRLALDAGAHTVTVRPGGGAPERSYRVTVERNTHGTLDVSGPGEAVAGGAGQPGDTQRRIDGPDEPAPGARIDPVIAIGIASAGALVAAVCGVGVALVELNLNQPQPGADVQADVDAQLGLGRGLLVGTGVGVVVAAVGGAFIALSGEP